MDLRLRQFRQVERSSGTGGREHGGQVGMDRAQSAFTAPLKRIEAVSEIHRIGSGLRKIEAGLVHACQHFAHCARLRWRGKGGRNSGQEFDQRNRLAVLHPVSSAVAVVNRARDGAIAFRQMIEQAEEIRQFGQLDAALVHCQDEPAAGRFDQPVGIGYAFGNALGRNEFADIVLADKRGEFFGAEMRVDRHGRGEPIRSAGAAA